MDEDIYGTSIPHLKFKTVRRKIQHMDPVKIKSVPKTVLDNYKEVPIFLLPFANQWNRRPQHHITAYHVCHSKYDQ